MAFVRVKKIANKEYAYLVENFWTPQGSRQKTKKYLGRMLSLSITKEVHYNNISGNYNKIIGMLILKEIEKRGFINGFHHENEVKFDESGFRLTKGKKNVVIKSNEGFLCEHTCNELLNFKPEHIKFEAQLANLLLESGIGMPPEVFVIVYEAAKKRLIKKE
ncbi:hypothetical protein ACFLZN_02005 [Nanoarchaeota archaeon]